MVRVRGKETLEKSGGGVEDRCPLATDFHADGDLLQVDEVRVDAANVRRGTRVQVEVPEILAELERLDLRTRNDTSRYDRSVLGAGRTSPSGVLAVEPGFWVTGCW